MNWALRTGTMLGGTGFLALIGVFYSGGFGPCGGSFLGFVSILTLLACVPTAALFLLIGVFMELRPKPAGKPELL